MECFQFQNKIDPLCRCGSGASRLTIMLNHAIQVPWNIPHTITIYKIYLVKQSGTIVDPQKVSSYPQFGQTSQHPNWKTLLWSFPIECHDSLAFHPLAHYPGLQPGQGNSFSTRRLRRLCYLFPWVASLSIGLKAHDNGNQWKNKRTLDTLELFSKWLLCISTIFTV